MDKGYFMLRVTNINRATKNIVASASYRSDEALYSERTDEKIKFRNQKCSFFLFKFFYEFGVSAKPKGSKIFWYTPDTPNSLKKL